MASAPPRRRSIFRPCIDLHDGQVKQIVGGTLSDTSPETLKTNFVAQSVSPQLSDRTKNNDGTDNLRATLLEYIKIAGWKGVI
jgi:phosphoribosylformimino-5-aminoimidazole carboxamide ribonucleotide (ProFAR) isomerase